MAITIATLSEIIRHSDTVDRLLRGGNTAATYGQLVAVANDPVQLKKLIVALDGLTRNVRVLRETKINDIPIAP